MRKGTNKRRRPKLVSDAEIVEHLQESGFQVMGPINDDGDWALLALIEDAPPGTPPVTIPLFADEDGSLWGEKSIVDAVIRSAGGRGSPRSRSRRPRAILDELTHLEDAFSWIQASGCQGHLGMDQETGDRWIRIARCVPDMTG